MGKRAIILAGGKGVRLRPYTTLIPKPLVPIGGEISIMEVVIRQLKYYGFNHITIAVSHLSELIMSFFGKGNKWNVKIDYSIENKPLSTIGPLTLIDNLPENILVMNGDVLCDLNYEVLYNFHKKNRADVTVATYKRKQKIDFGVLKFDKLNKINHFEEKPELSLNVSMGIYIINRKCIKQLKRNKKYGFDNLMIDGLKKKLSIIAYPFDGYWLDIGRPDDYDKANEEFSKLKTILLHD